MNKSLGELVLIILHTLETKILYNEGNESIDKIKLLHEDLSYHLSKLVTFSIYSNVIDDYNNSEEILNDDILFVMKSIYHKKDISENELSWYDPSGLYPNQSIEDYNKQLNLPL